MSESLPQILQIGFFGLAIALLVGVTAGVAYLTWVEQWEAQRGREQQRKDILKNPKKDSLKDSISTKKSRSHTRP
jgi:hypothetical protein